MNRFCFSLRDIFLVCIMCSLMSCGSHLMGQEVAVATENFTGPDSTVMAHAEGVIKIKASTSLRLTPERSLKVHGRQGWVLELEYFSLESVNKVVATAGPDYDSSESVELPRFEKSETFSIYVARIGRAKTDHAADIKDWRLDLQVQPDSNFQIRNVKLRRETTGEFATKEKASQYRNAADPQALEAYLAESFDSAIECVSVKSKEISIAGNVVGGSDGIFLGDIPMEALVTEDAPYLNLVPVPVAESGTFSVTLPRVDKQDDHAIDRLTSRWQLYRKTGNGYAAMSHARYADHVACRSPELPSAKPASKKGLGGWGLHRDPELADELGSLGVSAVTVNVAELHKFVSREPRKGFTPFVWQGRTYYANQSRLKEYDRTFREAEKNGVMVSAILLITNPALASEPDAKLLGHPDAVRQGKFAMPNVTSADGIAYYGAILNLLAERWSLDDGVHGRVHHWIVHNEVDFGWTWTNAGKKSDIAYLDLYQRSMRLVDLIARQYDPHARAWITLTHHWGQQGNGHGYGAKRLLDLLVQFCQAEGDFPWALAYHPYPQSLFNPRTWEDDQATFDFETAKITPQNLEVLDAYMKRPEMRFRGDVRPVHLSENGFNSKDYSTEAMADQAAGMALAWKKIEKLSSIKSWQYHNWIDNRREGGLRIGLRKFSDDSDQPLGKKPIWHVYQALGTPQEDLVSKPYLETIGIQSWKEVIYTSPIQ